MPSDIQQLLERLKFELKFVEDGGYGRPPRTAWRPTYIFEDSPSCLNFDEPVRQHPCGECWLMQYVPNAKQEEEVPCRHIPLDEKGTTIDTLYRCGTQIELEETLAGWLRKRIGELEAQVKAAEQKPAV